MLANGIGVLLLPIPDYRSFISSPPPPRINGKMESRKEKLASKLLIPRWRFECACNKGELMTRFYIDSREVELPFNLSSLDQILKHVEDFCLAPNTVVKQVRIDGLPLIPTLEEKCEIPDQIAKRDKVEIFTCTVTEVSRDSIQEALAYLDRVETAIPSIATRFQESPGGEVLENLKQLSEGLYWLNLLLDKLKTKFSAGFDHCLINRIPVVEHHQKMISTLKQMIEAQERRDYFQISELLEYEILSLVPVWKEMFGILSDQVNAAQ
jgi:hypothetical protein